MTDKITYRGEPSFPPPARLSPREMFQTYGTYREVEMPPLPWYAGYDFIDLWCYLWGAMGALLTVTFVGFHLLKFLKGVC